MEVSDSGVHLGLEEGGAGSWRPSADEGKHVFCCNRFL